MTPSSIGNEVFSDCRELLNINVDEANEFYSSEDGVLFNKNKTELIRCSEGKPGSYSIPEGVEKICAHAFQDCFNLTEIGIPDGVTSIGLGAFEWCTSLKTIVIPSSVNSISVGAWVFTCCESLTEIIVDQENQDYSSEDGVLFNKDKTEIIRCPENKQGDYTIPDGVKSVREEAFHRCKGLTSLSIPYGVTEVGEWGFHSCSGLKSISMSSSVGNIDFCGFYGCNALETVYYFGTEEDWESTTIGESNDPLLNAEIIFLSVSATEIMLDQQELNMSVGDTETLTVTVLPENATNKDVTWTSDAPDIATVDNGLVTAVSEGTAKITASTVDGGYSVSCDVTVYPVNVNENDKNRDGYHDGDVAIINGLIENNGLSWTKDDPSGWPVSVDSDCHIGWNDGSPRRIVSLTVKGSELRGVLDVSKLSELSNLDCVETSITALNISGLANLTQLNCQYSSGITELDISEHTNLTLLWCRDTGISNLNVSNLTKLTQLSCPETNITELDVSKLINLTHLNCADTGIKELNVSDLTNLDLLDCANTDITELDVSKLTNLIHLFCGNTGITKLDVSNLTNLTNLSCDSTGITALDVLDLTKLNYLHCNDTNIASLDISTLTDLTNLNCSNTGIISLDVSNLPNLEHLSSYDAELLTFTVPAGYTVSNGLGSGALSYALPTPARDGYTFTGWYTAEEGGELVEVGDTFDQVTILYSGWGISSHNGYDIHWRIQEDHQLHFMLTTPFGEDDDTKYHIQLSNPTTELYDTMSGGANHWGTWYGVRNAGVYTTVCVFDDSDTVLGEWTLEKPITVKLNDFPFPCENVSGYAVYDEKTDSYRDNLEGFDFENYGYLIYNPAKPHTRLATSADRRFTKDYMAGSDLEIRAQYAEEAEDTFYLRTSECIIMDIPILKNITIIYDANGGIGNPPSSISQLTGTSHTVCGIENLVLSGHTFAGWNTKADGSGAGYQPGDVFPLTADTILYAQWTLNTYSITVAAAPSEGGTVSGGGTYNHGESATVNAEVSVGYIFKGWQENGQIVFTAPEYTFTANRERALTAVFEKTPTYTLMYDANGGYGAVPSGATALRGTEFTVAEQGTLRKSGYEFVGWNTKANATGIAYRPGTTITLNSDVTLYAQWRVANCTVSGEIKAHKAEYADITVRLDSLDGVIYAGTVGEGVSNNSENKTLYPYTINAPKGTYTLYVIAVTTEGVTVTRNALVTLGDKVITQDFNLPDGQTKNKKSEVKVDKDAPQILAGGLDVIVDEVALDSDTVEVEVALVVKAVEETSQGAAEIYEQVVTQSSDEKLEFVELTVEKAVTNNSGEKTTENLSNLSDLIQIVVPFDSNGRKNIQVYRYHEGAVDILTTVANEYGEKIEVYDTYIILYSQKFSTYAIGYKNEADTPSTPKPDVSNPSHSYDDSNHNYGYHVNLPSGITGGKVTLDRSTAPKGSTVVITAISNEGYELDKLTVTDRNGKELSLTDKGDNKFTFVMPSGIVNVNVSFRPVETTWSNPFADITEDSWYYEAVAFAMEKGIMSGYSADTFAPNDNLSRAMLAQILYNLEGKPDTRTDIQFTDVSGDVWYSDAVLWAAENGIAQGYDDRFDPEAPITREQVATMLWNYAGKPTADHTQALNYSDADKISNWAVSAMLWATENKVMSGYDGMLDPAGQATRAQIAQMMKNYLDN